MGLVSGLGSVPEDQQLNGLAVELASALLSVTSGHFTVGSLRPTLFISASFKILVQLSVGLLHVSAKGDTRRVLMLIAV